MQSVLHSLYYGKIIPWERHDPNSKERLEVVRRIESEEQYFIQKMTPDDSQRFQSLSDLYSKMVSSEDESNFSYGFTLGMLLMLDVMNQSESICNE